MARLLVSLFIAQAATTSGRLLMESDKARIVGKPVVGCRFASLHMALAVGTDECRHDHKCFSCPHVPEAAECNNCQLSRLTVLVESVQL